MVEKSNVKNCRFRFCKITLELELEERTSEYLKQQKTIRDIEFEAEQEQIKERTQIENGLHKELLAEIANVQNKIAR